MNSLNSVSFIYSAAMVASYNHTKLSSPDPGSDSQVTTDIWELSFDSLMVEKQTNTLPL